jgi:hypothetical protein
MLHNLKISLRIVLKRSSDLILGLNKVSQLNVKVYECIALTILKKDVLIVYFILEYVINPDGVLFIRVYDVYSTFLKVLI